MKIAILVNELNIRGGTHKQVLRLCQYLKKCGEDVTIYTRVYSVNDTYPEFKEIKVVTVQRKKESSKSVLRKKIDNLFLVDRTANDILQSIDLDTDIINAHDMGFQRVMYLAKKKRNSAVVWQINDLPTCFRVGFAKNVKDSFTLKGQRIIERLLAKKIDQITVNVSKNKENIERCYKKDAEVFFCGVDFNNKLQKHHYKESNCINLLTMGVFYPHRNYEILVPVMENLINSNLNIHLDIIGSTENNPVYSKKIKDMINEKKLQEYITIWGQVDESAYNMLFNKANLFLFLNVNQSWGLAVFEAMSCGLPTLVSNSVGAIELLNNGKDAVIVNPFDVKGICKQIKMIMGNSDLYEQLSENALEQTQKFTWDNLYSSKMRRLFYQLKGLAIED